MSFPDLRFIPRDRRELQRRIPGRLVQVTSRGREDTKACFPFPAQEDRAAGELPLCVRIHVGKSFPPTRLLPPLVDLVTKPRKSFGAFLGSVLWWPKKSLPSFPDFPPNLRPSRRAGSGAINNLMVCPPSVARQHNGVWEKPRCDPGVVKPGKWQFALVTFEMSFTAGYFPFHWDRGSLAHSCVSNVTSSSSLISSRFKDQRSCLDMF